jgi:hypothetical protein
VGYDIIAPRGAVNREREDRKVERKQLAQPILFLKNLLRRVQIADERTRSLIHSSPLFYNANQIQHNIKRKAL